MDQDAHNKVLASIDIILSLAHEKIDNHLAALKASKEIKGYGITQLSKDVAAETGNTFTVAYAVISTYIDARTDIKVRPGRGGGIQPI